MNRRRRALWTGFFATIAIAGCGGSRSGDDAAGEAGSASQVEHMAVGTLNSVDPATGTVNISHEPVPSAGWPAMTMGFKLADPKAAEGLAPGQRVDFHFTVESGMNATVTYIAPID